MSDIDTSKEAVLDWHDLCLIKQMHATGYIEALAAERDAAVARAEKAEAERDELDFLLNEGHPDSLPVALSRAEARVAELESIISKRAMYRRLCDFRRRMNAAEARVAALEGVAEAFEHEADMRRRDFAVANRGTELNCLTRNGALEYGRVQMLEKCAADVRAALSAPPAPATVNDPLTVGTSHRPRRREAGDERH